MSRVQMGEKIRLVRNDGETQEVIVEELIRRSGREFARVRFPDTHFETLETTYLKPEPSRPSTDVEARIERGIQAAREALNGLDRTLRRPKVPDADASAAPKPPVVPEPSERVDPFLTWRRATRTALKDVGLVQVVVILCVGLLLGFYERVDSSGWVVHREDTTITAEPSWLVGESKECVSYPLDAGTAGRKGAGYAVDALRCDHGPEQPMKVTFWGRLNQPEYDVVNWKRTRKQGGFTCHELSGYRVIHEP